MLKSTFLSLNFKLLAGVIVMISMVGTIGFGVLVLLENPNDSINSNEIILTQTSFSKLPHDPYDIVNITLENDNLSLKVKYGGGCVEHQFSLFGASSFMESYPVQLNIFLSHNANGDVCEALITEELIFNISPIKQLYQQTYSETTGAVILNLEGTEYQITYQF